MGYFSDVRVRLHEMGIDPDEAESDLPPCGICGQRQQILGCNSQGLMIGCTNYDCRPLPSGELLMETMMFWLCYEERRGRVSRSWIIEAESSPYPLEGMGGHVVDVYGTEEEAFEAEYTL